jgi:hypothetical protein
MSASPPSPLLAALRGALAGALAFASAFVLVCLVVWAAAAYYAGRPAWGWPAGGPASAFCCASFVAGGAVRGVLLASKKDHPAAPGEGT